MDKKEEISDILEMAGHASMAIMMLSTMIMAYDINDDIELARAVGEARNFLIEVMNDRSS